jgi:hypothetical protein
MPQLEFEFLDLGFPSESKPKTLLFFKFEPLVTDNQFNWNGDGLEFFKAKKI